ncbi:MAG: TIGR00282 family metallophosphoesterase [Deltaproteobacteria bacterium]|jgi:metallophosphoesterase (TIGR00282 family)|nr:TIGR00282 family metallophosphoesterase [Deltaproteobacteria bacterium]MBN2844501.1 TIGR00282 family metallophosphoesterase [Deltaproteobacteria bacterium]
MKLLFVGDIVGKPGRRAVAKLLPDLIVSHEIDLVIANCENAAGGFGVTRDVVEELYRNRIDVLTSGNHIWDKKDVKDYMEDYRTLLRPANYPEGLPGWGSVLANNNSGSSVGVINVEGRVFMKPLDCPFRTAEREAADLKTKTNIIIVDIHAEATSEKEALGWYLDGTVSAVLGTHTHVQTADERVLPKGTAYITDVGMTGSLDSVLGIRKELAIERFLTLTPNKFDVAKENVWLQAVVIDIDNRSGKSTSIERVNEKLEM